MIMIILSTLTVIRRLICGNNWSWLPELESDQRATRDWRWKWLADFNAEKAELVSFDWSNNSGAIDVKMSGSVLEEK